MGIMTNVVAADVAREVHAFSILFSEDGGSNIFINVGK
jgi:hypothetical protein